ncbi:MAG: ABC transporter permease [Thermoplasmatota archaeon]
MMGDVAAILWKEWRDLVRQRTTRFGLVVLVALFGVVLPLTGGAREARIFPLLLWVFLPFILCIPIIADSFAGERERHTLETLLATRLSETTILAGKVGIAVLYSLGGAAATYALSSIVTMARWGTLPDPLMALVGFLLGLSVALLSTSAGVLVSLRARTVRQAQQVLGFSLMFLILGSQLLAAANVIPGLQAWLLELIAGRDLSPALLLAGGILAVDALLLALCRAAFQREKLLLS